MISLGSVNRAETALAVALVAILTFSISNPSGAQTFTTPDQSFSFKYPQRWEAADSGGMIKITAPDGSHYTLKIDTVETALTAGSAVNDTGLKQAAAKLATPIATGATFIRASSISMDHGQGASFRFKTSSGDTIDVWIGLIGKHSAVLTPAKAGQPGQTIGLSVIFQTMAFADALPKQPARKAPKPDMMDNAQAQSPANARTVLYSKQLAPILSQRCVACHSSQSASGGLNTSSYSAFLAGGSRGSVIKPGNVAGSTLIEYLTGARDQMPKGSAPLSGDQIDLFRTWIREGATNDLDPSSGRTAATTGVPNNTAAANGTRLRNNNSVAPTFASPPTRVAARMPKPMESYAGHLASNDSTFDMKLYTNGSVTASWTFDQPSPARYQGTYTTTSGVYTILMNLVGGSIPGGSKSLKLVMQATGTDVIGKFSLDGTSPKYKIMGLQLAEIDNASKNPNTQGTGAAATNRKPKRQKQRTNNNRQQRPPGVL